MIYLLQNSREYDYDVRAIALTFFERAKIVEVSGPEWDRLRRDADPQGEDLFMRILYSEKHIEGEILSCDGRIAGRSADCDYLDHENHRNDVSRFLYRLCSAFTGRVLPWGTLTGIRPTKIIMKWMEEEENGAVLEQRFTDTYLADPQKASLCRRVAAKEREILSAHNYEEEYSLYIGIPFCPTTCLYCSFASFPVSAFKDRMEPYLHALFQEMRYVSRVCRKPLTSIYVGGGTPTALDERSLQSLMDKIHRLFPVESVREFTVEAGRPDSITEEKFRILREAGVGRVSINPQTMHQDRKSVV